MWAHRQVDLVCNLVSVVVLSDDAAVAAAHVAGRQWTPFKLPVQLLNASNVTAEHEVSRLCAGAPKLTLVTPWGRQDNDLLPILLGSIRWECISLWVICYDLDRLRLVGPQFKNNSQVLELFNYAPTSAYGNLQRQEALNKVTDGMVYFLDEDNAMHPKFWQWYAANATLGHVYTFDQLRGPEPSLLRGRNPVPNCIDTAQILFDKALVGNASFGGHPGSDTGDGRFIQTVVAQNRDKHIYVPDVLCYHNFAKHWVAGVPWTRSMSHTANISTVHWDC
ncbi:hypothetical protein COO60DRAFT_528102 [Scenedesmus sp. NREL 46B-D3]|nr:hypothetical protein COO60DRAFT_528102 [Scenedesmus sp. NREL 46B-D3]